MIIVINYHSFIDKFDVPLFCFPSRQKEKYVAAKQWVWGEITGVTPYVIALFWRTLFLAFLFQSLISLN